ncbi:MAG TPA: DUF2059 domain-containing protein [Verrucomicrobiae bacterium]|nr:DUF2059 domain-containing protein [Verrucomicrobiae bacterium]
MKRFLSWALFIGLALSPVFAQQSPTGDAPATKEDVENLFATMHIREQMQNMMDVMSKQSKQMAEETLKKRLPDISQKDRDRVNSMMDEMMKKFDLNGMIDDMIPVYQRHLTKADISAMAQFYETPTGQKLLREQPQMTAEAMEAVRPRMEKMMSDMMDEAEKMARESASEPKPTPEKN